MTEKEIETILKGQMLDKKSLTTKLEAITAEQQRELETELKHLIFAGIVGEHSGSYYLLADQKIYLAKATMKTHNFIILKSIPDNIDIKISGRESDGLLVGDLLYVKQFQQGIYHALDYLKAVKTLKGRYSLTANGQEQLLVNYLNTCGKNILIASKADNLVINQGDLVEGEIKSFTGNTITVNLTKPLVKASNVGSDISMIISSNDAPLDFPDEVVNEAKALPTEVTEEEKQGRTDFRDHCVVTIDGDDAHDFDDAVEGRRFGKGYEVVVHIADVTNYVKPTHPLDDEAIRRGTSIYVADRVVPMLPFELSNGICSLNPGVDRLVLSVTMDVDALGNVFNTKVEKGLIRSHGRLTYNKVNAYFEGKDCEYSQEIKDTLSILHECSSAIRKRRELQGAMRLDSTELKFNLDENGVPTDVIKEVQGESEKMIEDLMIIANCSVAKALKHAEIPVLYRVHEFPPLEKLSLFKDFIKKMDPRLAITFPRTADLSGARLNDFLDGIKDDGLRSAISHMMLRALAKARYCPDELGHFGLAELDYCHFTSPIRRYPDDIIHRLVKDYLIDQKSFDYDEVFAKLEELGDLTSAEEVRSDVIERAVDDLESSKYMLNHIGQMYHGKVVSMVQRGMFVETEIGIDGFLAYHCMHDDVFKFDDMTYSVIGKHHPEISFTIGTPIDIKVLASNPAEQEIDFATPEFYDRYALNLSEEDREDLSLNGIRIEDEDDYEPMMGRARYHDDDSDRDYPEDRNYYPEDERRYNDDYDMDNSRRKRRGE
ncbi:MAG: VacB/RNase II family 3'-5' exoribonuclease [Bacilli bacterium]